MRIPPPVAAIGGLAAVALVLSGCTGTVETPPEDNVTAPLLQLGSLVEPTSWDPAQANEGHYAPIYQAVYDTLLKRDPSGEVVPMLASEWSVSDDQLSYELTIRDDVTFSDGTALDSAVVVANLQHFQEANGPMASSIGGIQSIEAPDADTVILTLAQPNPALPIALSGPAGYMASPDALGTEGITTSPVGSGPYLYSADDSVVGSTITFVRNPDYWGDPLPFDEIEFQVLTDENARLNALISGQVDASVLNRASSAVQAEASGLGSEVYTTGWQGILFFDRDGEMLPELADPRVREALTLAIDKEAIVENVALGLADPTSQTFGPQTEGFREDLEDAYGYDPDRARELLAEAGAEDLSFVFPTSTVFDPAIYDSILQSWADIGVTVTRHEWGPGEAIASMLRADFPISWMSLAQRSDWSHVQFLLSPTATWNPFDSEDPELNGLIADYLDADEAGRAEIAEQINEFVVDAYWFAPVMREYQHFYFNDEVLVERQVEQAVPSIYNYRPSGS